MRRKQQRSAEKPEPEEYPRKVVQCEEGKAGEEKGRSYEELTTSPELEAYGVINVAEQNSGTWRKPRRF